MNRSTFAFLSAAMVSGPLLAGEVQVINGDAAFPEGPFWTDGKLYYAEYGGNRVSVWDGTENGVLWRQDGCGPSAVMPFAGGWLVTCYDNGTLVQIGPDGRTDRVWDKDSTGAALVGPNDGISDRKGGAYVTASGPWESGPIVGKVYHLAADGALTAVADDLHYANGVQRSADGKLLYVNESEAGRVITFAVQEDGSLADRRLFARLTSLEEPADAYPDGIKLGGWQSLHRPVQRRPHRGRQHRRQARAQARGALPGGAQSRLRPGRQDRVRDGGK
jgi:gluconolactonase